MENRHCQFDVSEMPRALAYTFVTGLAIECFFVGAKLGIEGAARARLEGHLTVLVELAFVDVYNGGLFDVLTTQ